MNRKKLDSHKSVLNYVVMRERQKEPFRLFNKLELHNFHIKATSKSEQKKRIELPRVARRWTNRVNRCYLLSPFIFLFRFHFHSPHSTIDTHKQFFPSLSVRIAFRSFFFFLFRQFNSNTCSVVRVSAYVCTKPLCANHRSKIQFVCVAVAQSIIALLIVVNKSTQPKEFEIRCCKRPTIQIWPKHISAPVLASSKRFVHTIQMETHLKIQGDQIMWKSK